MIAFLLLLVGSIAQPLDSVQYGALWGVLDGLGCPSSVCQRFSASAICPPPVPQFSVVCSSGQVVALFLGLQVLPGNLSQTSLGQLSSLTSLTIRGCDVTGVVPTTLNMLNKLQVLNLGGNRFSSVPSLSNLTQLRELSINNNPLKQAPPQIGSTLLNRCNMTQTFYDCPASSPMLCRAACGGRVSNDDCDTRKIVSGGKTSLTLTSDDCVTCPSTCKSCGACAIRADIWFEYKANCSGVATIETCGLAPADTMIQIHRAACPAPTTASLINATCDDYGGCGRNERVNVTVFNGETLIMRLGLKESTGTVSTTGSFSITCTPIASVNCTVSQWSSWSPCSATLKDFLCTNYTRYCSGGLNTRMRSVVTPAQGVGTCVPLIETVECVVPCSGGCVQSQWSNAGVCSAACGGGVVTRTRTVTRPPFECGSPCGPLTDTIQCNTQPCATNLPPVNCTISPFVAAGRCSVPACGGGNLTLRATVVTPAQAGGKPCPSLSMTQKCNDAPCPAVLQTGLRWQLISPEDIGTFVWPLFRTDLAHVLKIDENRLQLVGVSAGSTIVVFTLLDADGDPAASHVARLMTLANDPTTGLNIIGSSAAEPLTTDITTSTTDVTTTTTAAASAGTNTTATTAALVPPANDNTTTIIAAVVGSVGGLILVGGIVAWIVVAKKKKQEPGTTTATELTPTAKPKPDYAPAPDASLLRRSVALPSSSNGYDAAPSVAASSAYSDVPGTKQLQRRKSKSKRSEQTYTPAADASLLRRAEPPSARGDDAYSSAPRTDEKRAELQKRKSRSKRSGRTTHADSSLVRQSRHPGAGEVLHIPLQDVELGETLGEGAFGIVYKGKWHGKHVAVKQVKAGAIGGNKAMAEFEAEVANMAKVPFHENLVQLHGVTTLENGDLAAVVEFCANGALSTALYGDKARVNWALAVLMRIAHGAACGVGHLHLVDFVHRDIAARNVLLTRHDEPKIADFGMARAVTLAKEQQTATSVGPLKWMAPEQMERRAYSKASDVFAFGVLLFEIFARELPWKGQTTVHTATKVLSGERMDLTGRGIPPPIEQLMTRCWATDPDQRPSMASVQRVLSENLVGGE